MIVTDDQLTLGHWLCSRIGMAQHPLLRCIGSVVGHKLNMVVGFDNYNGSSIWIHMAREGNCTRELLKCMFDYPFNVAKVQTILGMVSSKNIQVMKFGWHLGFKTACSIPNAHPDGDLVIMAMRREDCRFLARPQQLALAA